jgi:type III secretion system YscJ/HrcJ family lipoprotein
VPLRHRFLTAAFAAALLVVAVSGCKKDVIHNVTEAEANEIVVALADRGIAADKVFAKDDSKKGPLYTIQVEEGYLVDAKRVLLDDQLPRPREHGLIDAFSTPSMIPTEVEEKARYLTALQGDLANTLEQVDGVVDAKVHLVMPESNPLEAARDLTTARSAVLVKYRGKVGEPKAEEQVKKENDAYRATLISLGEDLQRLKKVILRDLAEAGRVEKASLVSLDTFFADKRGDDAESKEARAAFTRLKEASLKRDGTLRQLEALPKIKDLDQVLAKIQDLEIDALPFKSASVRALIARATPRLSEDDVSVEFTKVQPKPLKDATQVKAGPSWVSEKVVLALAGITAGLAAGLIALGLYIRSLMGQLAQARAAASKAAASLGASLTTAPPPAS